MVGSDASVAPMLCVMVGVASGVVIVEVGVVAVARANGVVVVYTVVGIVCLVSVRWLGAVVLRVLSVCLRSWRYRTCCYGSCVRCVVGSRVSGPRVLAVVGVVGAAVVGGVPMGVVVCGVDV